MKIFNKIMALMVCVCSFSLLLCGCSLWTLDTNKYLNQTVASYGDVKVTLEETYNAYYSYGNYYYDNQGDVTYDGIKKTATQLLNRKILVNELKNKESNLYLILNKTELNEVWESVYSSINSSVLTQEKKLLSADDLSLPSEEETKEEEKTGYEKPYQTYTKKYELVNGELKKTSSTNTETAKRSEDVYQFTAEELDGKTTEEKLETMAYSEKAKRAYKNFRQNHWNSLNHTQKNADGELYSEKAWNKYIANLKTNESGKDLSTVSEEVFYRELTRLYDSYYESKLISKFQNNFTDKEIIDEALVLSTYRNLATSQKESYTIQKVSNGKVSYPNYVSAMKNRSAPVMYTIAGEDWFQVSHILLKYSDDDINELNALKTKLENDQITESYYNSEVQRIKANVKVTDRETGEEVTVTEVLSNLQSDLFGKTPKTRIQIFNNYIYRYNMDDGVNNADYAYYIPANKENDSMVTPFANESRNLRSQGIGSISGLVDVNTFDKYIDNNGEEQTPSYSGFHIIMYLGEIETANVETPTLSQLDEIVLNPLNNNETNSKTMLDYVIDQISNSKYSSYESSTLANLKSTGSVNYYSSVVSQLVSKFSK